MCDAQTADAHQPVPRRGRPPRGGLAAAGLAPRGAARLRALPPRRRGRRGGQARLGVPRRHAGDRRRRQPQRADDAGAALDPRGAGRDDLADRADRHRLDLLPGARSTWRGGWPGSTTSPAGARAGTSSPRSTTPRRATSAATAAPSTAGATNGRRSSSRSRPRSGTAGRTTRSWSTRARGVFADTSRVHAIDHEGEHFSVAGPLDVPRAPQGRPVLVQAGSSESDGTSPPTWRRRSSPRSRPSTTARRSTAT